MRYHLPVCDKKLKELLPLSTQLKNIAGMEVGLHIFFISAPVILTPGKNHTTHWLWGWWGLEAGLEVWDKKHLPLRGYKPRAVQPVVIPITPTWFLASVRNCTCSFGNHTPTEFTCFPLKRSLRSCHAFLHRHVRLELRLMCRSLQHNTHAQ